MLTVIYITMRVMYLVLQKKKICRGYMGIYLAKMNKKFLIGQSVDEETIAGIKSILLARPAIEEVLNVQSQWIGPYAFSYKAEVKFCRIVVAYTPDV
jgi:hypothetical protein